MAEERFHLIFDQRFPELMIAAGKVQSAGAIPLVGRGAPVVMNHLFTDLIVLDDNVFGFAKILTLPFADFLYPVIDTEKKQVLGVLFTSRQFWFVYKGVVISKGTKIELGRYLAMMPQWRMLLFALNQQHGLPGNALLLEN